MGTTDYSIIALENIIKLSKELNAWITLISRHKAQQKRQITYKCDMKPVYNSKTNKIIWKEKR